MNNIKNILIATVVIGLSTIAMLSFGEKNQKEVNLAVDKYKVIKVNGQIIFKQTHSPMKSGDYFVGGTALDFENQYSRAAVISKTKGRFVLTGGNKGKVKILPAANNVSSRAGALINTIDLQNHFNGKLLVINKMEIEVGESAYPQNESSFFYVSYNHKNELIRKKLKSNGNKIVFDKNEIFKVDGKAIPVEEKEMTLYYRTGKTSKKINTFTPVFPNEDDLKIEIKIILDEFENKENSVKIKEIEAYLTEFYGKTQKENVEQWLNATFKVK